MPPFSATDEERSVRSVLENMLKTGEGSNLKIKTVTRTYNVHKSVIFIRCPLWKAIYDSDSKTAKTGIIELPEDELTVHILLQHLYGFLSMEFKGFGWEFTEVSLIRAIIAGDKYQLKGLRENLEEYLNELLGGLPRPEILTIAIFCYHPDRRALVGPRLLKMIVETVAGNLQCITTEKDLWKKIMTCPDLLRDAVDHLAFQNEEDPSEREEYGELPSYLREKA